MEGIRNFKNLTKDSVAIAGGKGASLGEMTQAGIPVPPGFVVLSTVFDNFIEKSNLQQKIVTILDTLDYKNTENVEAASEEIQSLIKNVEMPEDIVIEIKKNFTKLDAEYVAVRSSATAEDGIEHAWAGQLDTFLNVTESELLKNVQYCWASLFTPRAIFYRFEKGLQLTNISVAVVVQKMVDSEISGVAFSVHPVTEEKNQMIIEAGFGLGEAIVSGQITPDNYIIQKEPRKIIETNIAIKNRGLYRAINGGNEWITISEPQASSQALPEAQILELAEMIITIENHYTVPCDIEWAYEDNQLYILQSRPITTFHKRDTNADLQKFTSTTASLEHADGLPVYTEMTMAGFTDRLQNTNLPSYEIGISHFIGDGLDYISLIDNQNVIGGAIIKEYLENPTTIIDLYKKWMLGFEKMLANFTDFFDYDVQSFSDTTLMNVSDKLYSFYREEVSMPGFTDGFMFYAEKRLNDLILEYCTMKGLENYTEIFTTLTASTEASFFNEKEFELSAISDKESKEQFLKKYAWIHSSYAGYTPYTIDELENELKDVSDPAIAKKQLETNKRMKKNLIDQHEFNPEILAIVELTDLFIKWQDQRKVYTLSYVTLRAKIVAEISRRFSLELSLIEYALTEELPAVLDGSLSTAVLRERRECGVLFIHKKGKLQDIITGDTAEAFVAKLQVFDHDGLKTLSGTIASRGKAVGKVRIIMSAKSISDVQEGEILVAPMTRPEHVMGMKKAAAIITDDGGITCHAAIVSRELGKPCIIGTKNATKILKDGDMVEVDAEAGVVTIM